MGHASRFNAARGFVGGAAFAMPVEIFRRLLFQCRTRLCWWCSLYVAYDMDLPEQVSMPHAALLVVQHAMCVALLQLGYVSMPHAALLVVQPHRSQPFSP